MSTLINGIDLRGPEFGGLTDAFRRGLTSKSGAPIDESTWGCLTHYPAPGWPVGSLAAECTPVVLNPGAGTCWPDPCRPFQGRMAGFQIGTSIGCSCTSENPEVFDLEDLTRQAFESGWRAQIARMLWDGTTSNGTIPVTAQTSFAGAPHFTGPGGAPYPLYAALKVARGQIRAAGYHGPVVAHVPDLFEPDLMDLGAVKVGTVWKLGTLTVASDSGYPGTDPDAPNATTSGIGTGRIWVGMSGPGSWEATAPTVVPTNPLGDMCRVHKGWRATATAAVRVMPSPLVVVLAEEI